MSEQILVFLAALIGAGALAGFSAGLFGIGGGAVMVPALFYMLSALGYAPEHVMHCAVATSSAVIIINSIRSVRAHHAHGAVDWQLLWPPQLYKSWGVWIATGALLASAWLAPYISGAHLTMIFGGFMIMIAAQFIFGRPGWRLRDDVPGGAAIPIGGGLIGGLSALMGIGGGALSVSLMAICGKPIHRAIATASGIGVFISIPATLGFIISGWGTEARPPFSFGYVNLAGFAILAISAMVLVPYGAALAHKTDQARLKMIFGIFLLLVSANMVRKAAGF